MGNGLKSKRLVGRLNYLGVSTVCLNLLCQQCVLIDQ